MILDCHVHISGLTPVDVAYEFERDLVRLFEIDLGAGRPAPA